ncbi:hypothetical protein JRI60_08170 [Archangium violaceum]|uniref:hypothetical protein n=1 Tax=Archangium violaceum TaxID=83451 RepID=UPI001950BBC1|nr:hypothetical protein [Archangium violaceum]QRN98991.1 hypothetical protein JRI60_08170 [Archangium violaceum]
MRSTGLVVVLFLSGCRQSASPEPATDAPTPEIVLEQPAGPGEEKTPGAESALPGTPGEPQKAPGEEVPDQTWSARSANGNAEVRQTALRNGKERRCSLVSTVSPLSGERSVVSRWDTCIARREQLKFVSPDGKRVLVVDPFPTPIQGDWRNVEVATLYEHGLRVTGATAGELIGALDEAREPTARFAWVKGEAGLPGTPPRYSSDGKRVELETVDGRSVGLGFEGQGFPVPAAGANTASAPAMYQYEDAKGTRHFVSSLSEVPTRYQARAVAVRAEVGIVPASTPVASEEPRPSEAERPASPGAGKAETALEDLQNPSPTQLIKKAREEAKKLEEVQRDKAKQLDSLR